MINQDAYIAGFCKAAEEHGVNPQYLANYIVASQDMQKQAQLGAILRTMGKGMGKGLAFAGRGAVKGIGTIGQNGVGQGLKGAAKNIRRGLAHADIELGKGIGAAWDGLSPNARKNIKWLAGAAGATGAGTAIGSAAYTAGKRNQQDIYNKENEQREREQLIRQQSQDEFLDLMRRIRRAERGW